MLANASASFIKRNEVSTKIRKVSVQPTSSVVHWLLLFVCSYKHIIFGSSKLLPKWFVRCDDSGVVASDSIRSYLCLGITMNSSISELSSYLLLHISFEIQKFHFWYKTLNGLDSKLKVTIVAKSNGTLFGYCITQGVLYSRWKSFQPRKT